MYCFRKPKKSFLYDDFFSSNYTEDSENNFDKKKLDSQIELSPRLAISHPITETSKLYFNYGLNNGEWATFTEEGKLFSIGFYSNDYKNGLWKYFFKSGYMRSEGIYSTGFKNGQWIFFYENKNSSFVHPLLFHDNFFLLYKSDSDD